MPWDKVISCLQCCFVIKILQQMIFGCKQVMTIIFSEYILFSYFACFCTSSHIVFLIFTFSFYPHWKRMAEMFRKLSVPVTITENKFSGLSYFPTHMFLLIRCIDGFTVSYPHIPLVFNPLLPVQKPSLHPCLPPPSEKGLLDMLGFPWWSEQKQTVEPPQHPGLAQL